MRTLYVNHTSRISGGELSLISLLGSLPAGIEPVVACPEGDLAERARGMGIEVVAIPGTDGSLRLHPTRTPLALVEMGRAAARVHRTAASSGADLVHANSIRAGLIATGAGVAGGPPTVVHVRDCLPDGVVSTLTLRAIGRADALIANSAHTQATLGPGRASSHVIHNAVDLTRFEQVRLSPAEARQRLGLDDRGPILAVIAQITPWKGQDDAIRIATELAEAHPGLQLLLVGSPKFDSASTRYDNTAYLDSLHRLVSERRLEGSVRFLGERDDVPELLRAVDLLLVPSWEEPFGRTIIEAMASGVPVVATDVGGPPEILGEGDRRSGLVLPPRQPGAWARAIRELLADPALVSRMGERGNSDARTRFGLRRQADDVAAVYASVLGTAAGAS